MPGRLLLLTGIPCTGKTCMGRWLEEHHGFVHIDVEHLITHSGGITHALRAIAEHSAAGKDVVVTWGFMPGQDEPTIKELQRRGFTMVWLDGDVKLARRLFVERRDPPPPAFDAQMQRIVSMDLASFKAVKINPFVEGGGRLPPERLAEQLLAVVTRPPAAGPSA